MINSELCLTKFSTAEWTAGVAEMTAILQGKASSLSMITYSELSKHMQSVAIGYHDPAMDDMLLEVSRNEAAQGRGLLSADRGAQARGHGAWERFYGLAESMGLDTSDRTACWIHELHKVHGYWSGKS